MLPTTTESRTRRHDNSASVCISLVFDHTVPRPTEFYTSITMGGKIKKRGKRPAPPKPGDPDYKTPTQLRNARKRRKLQKDRAAKDENDEQSSSVSTHNHSQKVVRSQKYPAPSVRPKDPSQQYIHNPKSAPTVQTARRFFEHIFRNQKQQSSYNFPIYVGPKTGWRTVARLAVRPSKEGDVKIGLFVPGSHELLEVPDCPAHHPRINDAVKAIQEDCNQVSIDAFDEKTGKGHLRYLAISIERMTGRQQVTLVWNEGKEKNEGKQQLDKLVFQLIKRNEMTMELELHSLWVHYNNSWKHANFIVDREGRWEQVFGKDSEGSVKEFLLEAKKKIHVPLFFPPQVFRQANLDAFAKIVLKIREWLCKQSDTEKVDSEDLQQRLQLRHCLELYGGVGTIGLNLLDMFRSLESSDENPHNKACFEASVRQAFVNGNLLKSSRRKKILYQSKSATDIVNRQQGQDYFRKRLKFLQTVKLICMYKERHETKEFLKRTPLYSFYTPTMAVDSIFEYEYSEKHLLEAKDFSALLRRHRTKYERKIYFEGDY